MALAKLGAIITNLSGSIGGTTARRASGAISLYNRPNGASASVNQIGGVVAQLGYLSRQWSQLNSFNKKDWNDLAYTMTFPNRFGDQRRISGKSLFVKCNGSMLHYNQYNDSPLGLSTIPTPITIVEETNSAAAGILSYVVGDNDTLARYLIRVIKLRFPGQQVFFQRQKVLSAQILTDPIEVNLFVPIRNQFGPIVAGQEYAVAFYSVSELGIATLWRTLPLIVQP